MHNHIERNILWEDLKKPQYLALIQMLLDNENEVRFTVTGQSMRPFLRGLERVTIRKEPPGKHHTGDLIFFLNKQGTPILHRIIQKKSVRSCFTFITKGDGLSYMDEPFTEDRILGKAIRIDRRNEPVTIDLLSLRWIATNYLIAGKSLIRWKLSGFLASVPRTEFCSRSYRFFLSLITEKDPR